MPDFRPLKAGRGGQGIPWHTLSFSLAYVLFGAAALLLAGVVPDLLKVLGPVVGGLGLLCLGVVAGRDQPSVRTAGHLLRAPALTPQTPAGSSGSLEGGPPGRGRAHEAARGSDSIAQRAED